MSDASEISLDNYKTTIVAIVGPPCSGKSTATDMLRDMGIPCKDTGDAIRAEAERRYDGSNGGPDEDYVWNVANLIRDEHGPAGPTMLTEDWIKQQRVDGHELLCIASLRSPEEVRWLRENVGETLVVRVDANQHAREERYIDQHIDDDCEAVSSEETAELRKELYERELREQPYPQHDVQIRNENSISMRNLWEKLDNLVTVLSA